MATCCMWLASYRRQKRRPTTRRSAECASPFRYAIKPPDTPRHRDTETEKGPGVSSSSEDSPDPLPDRPHQAIHCPRRLLLERSLVQRAQLRGHAVAFLEVL